MCQWVFLNNTLMEQRKECLDLFKAVNAEHKKLAYGKARLTFAFLMQAMGKDINSETYSFDRFDSFIDTMDNIIVLARQIDGELGLLLKLRELRGTMMLKLRLGYGVHA